MINNSDYLAICPECGTANALEKFSIEICSAETVVKAKCLCGCEFEEYAYNVIHPKTTIHAYILVRHALIDLIRTMAIEAYNQYMKVKELINKTKGA